MLLETIHSPADVKALDKSQLPQLCQELREFLIESVSRTGGHLASNLGAVELTVAIHRVFDTASDRLVFDVGHQCYVHKALTGRQELFSTLRQLNGLSGFPNFSGCKALPPPHRPLEPILLPAQNSPYACRNHSPTAAGKLPTLPGGTRPAAKPTWPPKRGRHSVTCADTSACVGREWAGTNGSLQALISKAGTATWRKCGRAEARCQ